MKRSAGEGVILFIRCKKSVRKRFKMLVAKHDFPNYEVALQKLLELAETHPDLVDVVWG